VVDSTPVRLPLALLSLSLLAACASLSSSANGGEVEYGADADSNLKKGNEALESKNYPDAERYFEYVKTKYPFLEAAVEAELRLADTDFERDEFSAARDRYQNFVRLHPTNAKVDYAAYRAALTHYKDMPSDFFLLPPSAEKDQVEVKSALNAMENFVDAYPDSKLVPDAKKVIVDVKRRLADHELYVADFYAKREVWKAVVLRLNTVAKKYPDVGYEERVYFGLYDAWNNLKDSAKAAEALRTLVAKYPGTDGAKKAEKVLAKAAPAPDATPAPPPAPAPAKG